MSAGDGASPAKHAADVAGMCDALEALLSGRARREILDVLGKGGSMASGLRRLRSAMADHALPGMSGATARTVHRLDRRTRQDGFRVLHAWNHNTHRFTDEIVPVLLVDFLENAGGRDVDARTTLAILLDYYFLHLLALAAMRAWDSPDPGSSLDRVTGLVSHLQGQDGSGHRFLVDAESLLIYALSQFHPDEHAYDRVIDRVSLLSSEHQVAFARVSAAVLGSHLRWGFWLMYGRDVVRMRDDNVGDYPWLLYTVLTLTRAWSEADDEAVRSRIAGSLLLGLAADPWAFRGNPPPALEAYGEEYDELRALLQAHGHELLDALEEHRPTKEGYAPLSLHFNFPHNALVAIVTLALLEGRPQRIALNDLFDEGELGAEVEVPDAEREPVSESVSEAGREPETKEGLARALMAFSRGSPDRLGYRGAMLVAYDPLSAMRSFSLTVDALRKSLG